jgi:hypothetical protein
MPDRIARCVAALIAAGKTDDEARAISTAQFADTYHGVFNDTAVYDPKERTALSVRDGVLEYLGSELNMQPTDHLFTVYRSPATIANTAVKMRGLPITDGHVELDMPPPTDGGFVSEAEMVDAADAATSTTIAIRNRLAVSDTLLAMVDAGRRELSLGYHAELVPHGTYDFEQRALIPHHLATVDKGRCGPMCSFIDKKPTTGDPKPMPTPAKTKLHKAFVDAEGAMNLQQIVELATALPEAIKSVPVDQLTKLLPALQQIVEAAKAVMPAEAPAEDPPVTDEEKAAMQEQQKKEFGDAVTAATQAYGKVIGKARNFLPADYEFADKSANQIMRDAIATDTSETFADAELPLAFKMLRKPESRYQEFGDHKPNAKLAELKNKEL